eukprot:11224607-Lingulodinium_polyedra.AAC.1
MVQGAFDPVVLAKFSRCCAGNPAALYGRAPCRGEPVAGFSGAYPIGAMAKIAAGAARVAAAAVD